MKKSEFCKKVSIIDIYNEFSQYRCENSNGVVLCPFHEDKTPSMKLYPSTNRWICFGCNEQGSTIDFVMKAKNIDFVGAINMICNRFGYTSTPSIKDADAYEKAKIFHNYMEKIADKFTAGHSDYWTKRGISDAVVIKYKLGSTDDLHFDIHKNLSICKLVGLCNTKGESMYNNRYIIPIRDKNGFICGFAGRKKENDNTRPKYVNTSECAYFHKSQVLYNYDVAKGYNTIYVVEGYMDALSLITVGIQNVVATMGTALTKEHIDMLKGKNIILCFDTDAAGIQATMRVITKYKEQQFQVLKALPRKDFNEVLTTDGADAVVAAAGKYEDGIVWLVNHLVATIKTLEDANKSWEIIADVIGALEPAYQTQKPLNTIYTPVALHYYWNIYYKKLKEVTYEME